MRLNDSVEMPVACGVCQVHEFLPGAEAGRAGEGAV